MHGKPVAGTCATDLQNRFAVKIAMYSKNSYNAIKTKHIPHAVV